VSFPFFVMHAMAGIVSLNLTLEDPSEGSLLFEGILSLVDRHKI